MVVYLHIEILLNHITNMKLKERYKLNKVAKVGDSCICPSCNSKFVKTNYQQAFCKTKPGTVCKDKYWNTVIPTKRCNTTRISPASKAYMAGKKEDQYYVYMGVTIKCEDPELEERYDYPSVTDQERADIRDREQNRLNFGGSWGDHDCHTERCEFCGYLNCRCE